MSELLRYFNTAATVLGYFSLLLFCVVIGFVIGKLILELVQDRRRKRFEQDEWDHERQTWLDHDRSYSSDLLALQEDRHSTDILDFPQTVEYAAVTYQQKENDKRERPRNRKSRQ